MNRPETSIGVLSFEIAGLWFGIRLNLIEGVSPLGEVVTVPGGTPQAFVGLTYLMGHLMVVIDMGFVSLRAMPASKDVVIFKQGNEYFAIKIGRVGSVLSATQTVKEKNEFDEILECVVEEKGMKVHVIEVSQLVRRHVCR